MATVKTHEHEGCKSDDGHPEKSFLLTVGTLWCKVVQHAIFLFVYVSFPLNVVDLSTLLLPNMSKKSPRIHSNTLVFGLVSTNDETAKCTTYQKLQSIDTTLQMDFLSFMRAFAVVHNDSTLVSLGGNTFCSVWHGRRERIRNRCTHELMDRQSVPSCR